MMLIVTQSANLVLGHVLDWNREVGTCGGTACGSNKATNFCDKWQVWIYNNVQHIQKP